MNAQQVRVMMRALLSILLLVTGMVLLPVLPAQAQGDGWTGLYYDNPTLSGIPVLTRVDQMIDFVWGDGSPAPQLPANGFSVRWTTSRFFEGGTYRFTVLSDDGVRVYVDDQIIIDAWYEQPAGPGHSVEVAIPAGDHRVRVEYYENTGLAQISLTWEPVGVSNAATWTATYFDNPTFAGQPVIQRSEEAIDHIWGYNSPAPGQVPAERFSARWIGAPIFTADTYVFSVNADDGVRLWIDEQLVLDAWYDSGFTPAYTANVTLGEGQHAIRLEYYENTGAAAIRLTWDSVNVPPAPELPDPAPDPTIPEAAWQARYFANADLSGPAIFSEQIVGLGLDLTWGSGSPNAVIPANNFSGRITRRLEFAGGQVRFVAQADDAIRLDVDGQIVLDEWHLATPETFFFTENISPGEHTLTVEYYEATQRAFLRLYWVPVQGALPDTLGITARVNAFRLNIRSGPGVSFPIIGRAQRSQVYPVTGRDEISPEWVRINVAGIQGWFNSDWTTLSEETVPAVPQPAEPDGGELGTPTGLRVRATTNVNIRSGPGTGFARIGGLNQGRDADVVGRNVDSTWWEINFANGRGWVSGTFVQLAGDRNASVPVTG